MEDKKVKDKTRVMAHSRRQRENDTFTDIAEALPIQENAKDLDKASILRVAIHYLKLRDIVGEANEDVPEENQEAGNSEEGEEGEEGKSPGEQEEEEGQAQADQQKQSETSTLLPNFSKDVLQALDGFMLVISSDGRILYTSETISNYLGLRQVDVIGIHIHDIIHPQDITELASIFKTQGKDTEHVFDRNDPLRRNFVIRMRCAFTPSVRSITRCSNFKPIYCSAFLKFGKTEQTRRQFQGVVALCKLASVSRIKEMCVGAFFKTKHSLDLGYTGIDTRIRWILGYDPTEMMGHKAYQYFHPEDLTATSSCHMNLLSQGHSHSPCYRFMSRWGDWLWVRSKSYVTYNPITHLPDGLLIYTWIVRLDEEDDRMKAIQDGKSADHLQKSYSNLASSISTGGGSLDISKLADPNADTSSSQQEEASPVNEYASPNPPMPSKPTRPAVIQNLSGRSSLSSSSPSPLHSHRHIIPSPPLTATSPPETFSYMAQQSTGSLSSSPERHMGSHQTGQAGYFGGVQQSSMPSPPYTPYDSSPQQSSQYGSPCISGANLHDYQGFTPAQLSTSAGYPPQNQQQLNMPSTYPDGQYMQQCHRSPQYAASDQLHYTMDITGQSPQLTGVNPNFEMQATVFTTSPNSSTLCYQPPNLTDLQLPQEPTAYHVMPNPNSAHPRTVNRRYINDARARYNQVACPVPGVHPVRRAGAGAMDTSSNQTRSISHRISQWSQWLQGGAPPAPVY